MGDKPPPIRIPVSGHCLEAQKIYQPPPPPYPAGSRRLHSSPMRAVFSSKALSLIRFAQVAAEMLAVALVPRLGLGRFGFTVFLRKPAYQAIAAELTFIEAVVRRALFLIAAMRGAIPAQTPGLRDPGEATRTSKPAIEASGNHRTPAPRFCLTEPSKPPLPRLRPVPPLTSYLGTSAGPDPCPADDILLPTARLVRRLRALETVFLDPEANILRMRRLLASTPQKILTRRGYDAASAASDHIVNFHLLESVQALADDAAGQLRLDTG